jgi:hypothetical protein
MRFVMRPDKVIFYFIGVFIFKFQTFAVKSNLKLLILELSLFGGFFSHFDLAGRRNSIPPVAS